MVLSDQKWKHDRQRKAVKDTLLEIKKHIESLLSYKSHYGGKDTDKKYLFPSDC